MGIYLRLDLMKKSAKNSSVCLSEMDASNNMMGTLSWLLFSMDSN